VRSQGETTARDSRLRREPKGYDFVRLPYSKSSVPTYHVRKVAASGASFSGKMSIKIETLSPLHISDGTLRLSEELGFKKGLVVKSILCPETPIIPGTTLKGAARTYYESITRSCVSQYLKHMRTRYVARNRGASNLPQQLVKRILASGGDEKGFAEIAISPECFERRDRCPPATRKSSKLCPACLLFGARGFAGRVSFADAKLVDAPEKGEFLYVPPRGSPQLHRLGRASIAPGQSSAKLYIDKLRGRRVYTAEYEPHGPSQEMELWDYVPTGAVFTGLMIFRDLSMAEMGGLFACLGLDSKMAIRIGAGKASGLGKISISSEELIAFPSGLMQRASEDPRKPVEDLSGFTKQCKTSFFKSSFAYPKSFEMLKKICAV